MPAEVPVDCARPEASISARTRSADANGVEPSRPASTSATNLDNGISRDWATSRSTCQNTGSSATLVRWPASEKLRLISPLSGRLPMVSGA
jgi:hypothetical protein